MHIGPKNKSNSLLTKNYAADLEELFTIIKDAHGAYEIWWVLVSREGRKQYANVMLSYKDFFECIAYSTLTLMVVSLYKLYEEKGNNLSLITMLEKLKVDLVSHKKLSRNISEATRLWKKICILRSNLLAHRSIKLTRQEIYQKANIKPNQVKLLIRLSKIIFNNLSTIIGNKHRQLEEYTYLDLHHVLEKLKS